MILTIPEGFSQMCQTVTVIGDIIREPPNEAFTVQITPENNNDIINEAFRVTIVEVIVDGKCIYCGVVVAIVSEVRKSVYEPLFRICHV